MYVNSIPCVKVKGVESEYFRIDSGVIQVCIMSPWLFSVYICAVMKEVKMSMGRMGVWFIEEGRLPGLLYADDLILYGDVAENLKVMMRNFVKISRRDMKVNANKRKVMVIEGEEGLEFEIHVDWV